MKLHNFSIIFATVVAFPSRHTTSFQRITDVETTSCVYWVGVSQAHFSLKLRITSGTRIALQGNFDFMNKIEANETLAAEVNAKTIVRFKVDSFKISPSLFIVSRKFSIFLISYKIKSGLCRSAVTCSK